MNKNNMTTDTTFSSPEVSANHVSTLGEHEILVSQATRITAIQDEIQTLINEMNSIKDEIIMHNGIGTFDADNMIVMVRKGANVLDTKTFTQQFPYSTYPKLYKNVPDIVQIHKDLTKDQLQPITAERKETVVVKEKN